MSKRAPCSPVASWLSGQLGDCGQHLVLGESPVVSGIGIVRRGGAYAEKPTVIFSGGGPAATGAYAEALLSCSGSGVVTGIRIFSSGWHYTESPTIIFSGKFAPLAVQTSGCMQGTSPCGTGTAWDHPTCMCSGTGLIFGYPIYENITLVPPQCSNIFLTNGWQDQLNNTGTGGLPVCDDTCLGHIGTTNLGRCRVTGTECNCKTTFESGWYAGDCSDGGRWQKSNNYCSENGTFAPQIKCIGPWTTCDKPINNLWRKTDQFLDVGRCTKRGHKNVVAFKSWHGVTPFTNTQGCTACDNCDTCYGASGCQICVDCTLQPDNTVNCSQCSACSSPSVDGFELSCSGCSGCDSCPEGEKVYTYKYLDSTWTASDVYSLTDGPTNANTYYNASASISASVDRLSSQVHADETYSVIAHDYFADAVQLIGPDFVDRCHKTVAGYPVSGWDGYPWNYGTVTSGENTYSSESVSTSGSISDNEITFHQTRNFSFIVYDSVNNVFEHDAHIHQQIDAVTTLSNQYTQDQLNLDADTLLNQWNLLNDVIYPWKYDTSELQLPKISRCEAEPTSPLSATLTFPSCPDFVLCHYSSVGADCADSWDSCTANDCPGGISYDYNCYISSGGIFVNTQYNGSILGAPSPTGYLYPIDFNKKNQKDLPCHCEDGDVNNSAISIKSYGGVSSLAHATQLPDEREKKVIYPGAFASINDRTRVNSTCNGFNNQYISTDILLKTKWAEIIQIDKPSQNFRLPCGIGSSKDLIYVNATDNSIVPYLTVATGCLQGCNCTPCMGGTGSVQSCTNATNPARWPYLSGSGFVCNTVASIFSGQISTGKINLYMITGISGDKGQYVNAHLMFGGSNFKDEVYAIAALLNQSGFSITGDFSAYVGLNSGLSGWIDFATGNDWFDNYPKGDFIIRSWDFHPVTGIGFNNRVDGFMNSQNVNSYCLPWKPCGPAIVVIAPSGSPENISGSGYNVQFVTMPALTPRPCGAKINLMPQQWRTDPFWIRPSKPCCLVSGADNPDCIVDDGDDVFPTRIIHLWEEDDGSCRDVESEVISNGFSMTYIYHHHYPMRPWVEARQSPLGPYGFSVTGCSWLTSGQLLNASSGCLSVSGIEGLSSGVYDSLYYLDSLTLSCFCQNPQPESSYWGIYAPWAVSTNQTECLRQADEEEEGD